MIKTSSKPWPWSKLRNPTPADWGIGMTVCIAAISNKSIICVSDRMVSMSGHFSGDNMVRKLDFIGRDWFSMIAGNDIAQAIPVHDGIRASSPNQEFTLREISQAARRSYRAQRDQVIEDTILPLYGVSGLDEYKAQGKGFLSEDSQYEIAGKIKQCNLNCELLITGFDPDDNPHILTINNPGAADYYDKLGFWAIGSGQQQAIASLIYSQFHRYDPLEVAVSKVLTAKFTAESASGVGKSTFGFVYDPQGSFRWTDEIEDSVRQEWKDMPKYPTKTLDAIKAMMAGESGEIVTEVVPPVAQLSSLLGEKAKRRSTPRKSKGQQ